MFEFVNLKFCCFLMAYLLQYYPPRVLPSKTAIAPINPTFLSRSEDEREMYSRTIYCTNIDKKLTQADVKHFFESICGEVQRLRLLGDYQHSTRIAFVVFIVYEEVSVPVIGDLILISDKAYSRKEVLEMEKLMVNTLQFNMSVPTCYVFITRFLKAAQADKKLSSCW